MLKKLHHLSIINILEPFSNSVYVQNFKVQLNMENATSNYNGKIWVFWSSDLDCNILNEDEQQITCDIKHNELQRQFITTFVYAKCKDYSRTPLWDKMHPQYNEDTKP